MRLVVLPPPLLVDALRTGQVDGFCVGEPWNSLAVAAGIGCIVAATSDIWPLGPEKVLGMRRDWAEGHPGAVASLVRAIDAASRWCDAAENHADLAVLLSEPRHVGAPASVLLAALDGRLPCTRDGAPQDWPDFLVFSRHEAALPKPEHAAWFHARMVRWGQIAADAGGLEVATSTYRPDIYRSAVTSASARRG